MILYSSWNGQKNGIKKYKDVGFDQIKSNYKLFSLSRFGLTVARKECLNLANQQLEGQRERELEHKNFGGLKKSSWPTRKSASDVDVVVASSNKLRRTSHNHCEGANERTAQNGFYRVEGLFCFDCFRDKISLISWAVVVAQLAGPLLPKLEFRYSNPVIGVTVTVENTKIKRPGMVDYNITHFHISLIMAKIYWFQLYLCVMTCILKFAYFSMYLGRYIIG